MPVYSFGQDSPLKFDIPDKLAKTYNDATLEFFKAQQRFNQKFGRDWDPVKEPIKIKWSKAHRKAWRDFGRIFDEANAAGGPYHVNDLMEDYLVKNVVSAVAGMSRNLTRAVGAAAFCGALYGLLRGR